MCTPPSWQVGDFGKGLVELNGASQAGYPSILRCVCGAAKKLPIAIVFMSDKQDRGALFNHGPRSKGSGIDGVGEGPGGQIVRVRFDSGHGFSD
jgi:hypothetical protein